MTSGNAAPNLGHEIEAKPERPAAILRGNARGLEIVVDGRATVDAVIAAATTRLSEAPTFFKGSDVRVRVEAGPLPAGSLARLDALATQFDLRIVEISAAKPDKNDKKKGGAADLSGGNAIPRPNLAAGSAPNAPELAPALAAGSGPAGDAPATRSLAAVSLVPPPNDVVMATARALVGALVDPRLPEAMASAQAGVSSAASAAQPEALADLDEEPKETRFERAKTAPEFERAKTEPQLVRAEPEPVVEAVAPPPVPAQPSPSGDRAKTERGLPQLEVLPETRLFVGPVRSGVILDHRGHLFVFGDVNPGAEVRATGNIVVLGRMRGTAHAGIGAASAFIVALRLEPQQLRIGRLVARQPEGEADRRAATLRAGETATLPEIAYVTDSSIVVERYQGRLPNGLASTLASQA